MPAAASQAGLYCEQQHSLSCDIAEIAFFSINSRALQEPAGDVNMMKN